MTATRILRFTLGSAGCALGLLPAPALAGPATGIAQDFDTGASVGGGKPSPPADTS